MQIHFHCRTRERPLAIFSLSLPKVAVICRLYDFNVIINVGAGWFNVMSVSEKLDVEISFMVREKCICLGDDIVEFGLVNV
jgi:hypothetical protein